jgi:hypothetical protein
MLHGTNDTPEVASCMGLKRTGCHYSLYMNLSGKNVPITRSIENNIPDFADWFDLP